MTPEGFNGLRDYFIKAMTKEKENIEYVEGRLRVCRGMLTTQQIVTISEDIRRFENYYDNLEFMNVLREGKVLI